MAYEFHLESLPVFNNTYDEEYSYAGLLIKLKRKSFGQLLSGYYYPTASFAILSLISFLISPDQVLTIQSKTEDPLDLAARIDYKYSKLRHKTNLRGPMESEIAI